MDEHKKDGMIEEVVEDLMEDPDAPEKGHAAPPPQTIDAEPSGGSGRQGAVPDDQAGSTRKMSPPASRM